jgi:RIO kinase 1
MARRLGRKKRPLREVHTLKEQLKIDSGIFDDQTMIYLSKFYNKGVIGRMGFIIARGKEAEVYVAEAGPAESVKGAKYVIAKFFRVETSSFLNMTDYVIGDPRFQKVGRNKHAIVSTWCKKEYGNLEIAKYAGVNAPAPYMFNGTILAMEFIGDDEGVPAPQLRDVLLENPEEVLDVVLGQVRKLYLRELVHADLSEYNILMKEGKPYFIDFGQAVVLRHPNSMAFLHRDVGNVLRYFAKRYGIDRNLEETLAAVTAPAPG